jgi:TIR domain-containing protein
MSKPKVFISYAYSDADRQWVRDFAQSLKRRGVSVWFDEAQLNVGDPIRDAIEDGLRSSDLLVAIIGPKSAYRPNLLFELGAAIAMGKRVVAVVPSGLDPSLLPEPLRTRRFLVQASPEETASALITETSNGKPA